MQRILSLFFCFSIVHTVNWTNIRSLYHAIAWYAITQHGISRHGGLGRDASQANGQIQSTATFRGVCDIGIAEGSGQCLFPESWITWMEVFTELNSYFAKKCAETVGFHFTFCLHTFLLTISYTIPVKLLTCACFYFCFMGVYLSDV